MANLAHVTPTEAELEQRIHWLVRLRWIAAACLLYGTWIATSVLGIGIEPLPVYLIAAALAAYNSWLAIALRWFRGSLSTRSPSTPRWIVSGQILLDLLFLTLLIHFTGGAANPFAFYYVFHIVIASLLLSRLDTFLMATAASLMFGGLLLAESWGVLSYRPLFYLTWLDPSRSGLLVSAAVLAFVTTIYLVAYMATSIVKRQRERDAEILQLNAVLERKADELEQAYQQVADLEKRKSQFTRKVAHEIRAPMAAIQSTLRVLLDGILGELPDKQREMIARADRRIHGLLSLVGDLLTLSRSRDAAQSSARKPVDMVQIVEKVVSLQAPRAEAKRIDLVTGYDGPTAELLADPEAIEQLATNLISNAINYTPRWGKVQVNVRLAPDSVQLRVADNGIGIAAEDLPKIFNEFYRAPNARAYCDEGTGLGMSIARSIVEAHDGDLQVESVVGQGTTFTATFPRKAREAPPAATEPRPEESSAADSYAEQQARTQTSRPTATTTPDRGEQHSRQGDNQGGAQMAVGAVAQEWTQTVAMVSGKDWASSLLPLLQSYGPVYGPIRKGRGFVFGQISALRQPVLDYGTTVLPPKKLLLKPMETLFSVRLQESFEVQSQLAPPAQVLFGIHSCDLSAIKLLDKVYQQDYVDPLYKPRREASLIVAMSCATPPYDKCFCASMGTGPSPIGGYDLLMTDLGDGLLLEAGSARGAALASKLDWAEATDEDRSRKKELVKACATRMPRQLDTTGLPQLLNDNTDHPLWTKLAERCLACGNCAMSCPSCYCYNVLDQIELDLSRVSRTRSWDACLLLDFAEVHGANFREEREARIKQFIYHKLSYWLDQYGSFGCVGCGRCIDACPAKIDITEAAGEIRGDRR